MDYYSELKKFYFKLFRYNIDYFYDDYNSVKSGLQPQWLMSHKGYYSNKLIKVLKKQNWLEILESYYDELNSEQSGIEVDDVIHHLIGIAFEFEKFICSKIEQIFIDNYTMYKKVNLFDNGVDEIKNILYSAIFNNWSKSVISKPYEMKTSSEIIVWWIYNQIDAHVDCDFPLMHLVEKELHKKITMYVIPLYARIYSSLFIDECEKHITNINYVNDYGTYFEYYDIKYLPRTLYKRVLGSYLLAYTVGKCALNICGNRLTLSDEDNSLTIEITESNTLKIDNNIVSIQQIKVLLFTMFGLSIKDISFYINK